MALTGHCQVRLCVGRIAYAAWKCTDSTRDHEPAGPESAESDRQGYGHHRCLATATCCRTCLARWHDIPAGRALDDAERGYVVEAICRWIVGQYAPHVLGTGAPTPAIMGSLVWLGGLSITAIAVATLLGGLTRTGGAVIIVVYAAFLAFLLRTH